MTTGSIGPGTVLADRYRLDDLLTESAGARFWRATDTILARSVAIHAVPSDDPRAPHLLEAARVSATVTDPHLLRVLDCDDCDGITWVVHEWGEGISLDLMLQRGTLPAARAAWLTREVAEAIAAGHAQGIPHGRLNPEAVLVTHAGAVKLIGYVVDATLETQPQDPLYGELDDREADVINLAGILYAALTGRWPGVARSAVPKAPREARRPLRPRQVRAGVPRTLDAICDRVLHKEAAQHTMPIETAHEIAAALADYVGDPALTAPLNAAGMHAEPAASLQPDELPAAMPDLSPDLSSEPDTDPLAAVPSELSGADPEATQRVSTPGTPDDSEPDDSGADPEATQQVPAPATPDKPEPELLQLPATTWTTPSSTSSPSTTPRPWPRCRRRLTTVRPPHRSRTSPNDRCSPRPSAACRAARAGQPIGSSPWSTPRDGERRRPGGHPGGHRGRTALLRRCCRDRGPHAQHRQRWRTRLLALRRQPRRGRRGAHRQGGSRLAADGDRDRRTPRAGGRHGDRLQPRSPERQPTRGLGALREAPELHPDQGVAGEARRRQRLRPAGPAAGGEPRRGPQRHRR